MPLRGPREAQFEAALFSGYNLGYQAGMSQMTNNPNNYGLYNLSQVQTIHVGTPLLAKDPTTGHFRLTIKAQKSVDLLNFIALPFSAGSATIDAEGAFKFDFTSSDNAAFFRLETR